MMDKFTGTHGVRFINPTDRKFEPRMTPLQLAGEVVGWLMIAAVLIGGAAYLEALFGAGAGQ